MLILTVMKYSPLDFYGKWEKIYIDKERKMPVYIHKSFPPLFLNPRLETGSNQQLICQSP